MDQNQLRKVNAAGQCPATIFSPPSYPLLAINMNKPTEGYNPGNRSWWTDKRVVCIALVLLAALYVALEPTLEKWLGVDLPDLVQNDDDPKNEKPADKGNQGAFKIDPSVLDGKSDSNAGKSSKKGKSSFKSSDNNGFQLTEIGRDSYRSPAGLVYTMGPRREHRIAHVMRHAKDQPSRSGPHGVFNVNSQDEVLKVLDKAYTMIKNKHRGVNKKGGDRNDEYTIDMPNVIGYVGGEAGNRQGKPKTKRLKLILNEDRVITAYPTWPARGGQR